ncbi:MAG: type I 3-dehydroquinate dehydratase [Verrucomicrobiaceae bacterium]|nr:type I 3-dehydroquinate dehydratase [Verrucomicrobiaceae bacterium]
MAQLVSSKNLLLSSNPLAVGVVSQAEVLISLPSDLTGECDAIELRLDQLGMAPEAIRTAVAGQRVPILLTARHPAEGGQASGSAAERMALIEPLLDLASLIDVELRSIGEMKPLIDKARACGVPVVGSFHDFQATPADEVLEGAIGFAENAGIDTVKIATFVNTTQDLIRLVNLVSARRRLRLSVMGMGTWGRVSRLLLAKCGSLLNYGFLGGSNAPGQWPVARLKSLLAEI